MTDAAHTVGWHLEQFQHLCEKLHPFTRRCIFSFIDPYKSIGGSFREMQCTEMIAIASGFSEITAKYGLELYVCAEKIELAEYGIAHSSFIDKVLIEEIIGYSITAKQDANQRPACKCIESVDIGAYDTCNNGCTYCYATSNQNSALRRFKKHDPTAPMITGYPTGNEIITDRTTSSQKINQLRLF